MAVWHCREKEIEYGSKVLLMGIVNVTPDSFSDGGDWLDPATALTHARALEAQGADILDIGGQSTRPGHTPVTDKEEWARLEPVLSVLCKETALPVSVDTYYPYVAVQALRWQTSREWCRVIRTQKPWPGFRTATWSTMN